MLETAKLASSHRHRRWRHAPRNELAIVIYCRTLGLSTDKSQLLVRDERGTGGMGHPQQPER
jgi:hypothetical protein